MYSHLKDNERVKCPNVECPNKSFTNYKTFNQHSNQHKRRNEFALENLNQSVIKNNHLIVENTQIIENEPIVIDSDTFIEDMTSSHSDLNDKDLQENVDLTFRTEIDIQELGNNIDYIESLFALKLGSKYLLPRDTINDIIKHCNNIHSMKMEYVSEKLKENFVDKENLNIQQVTENIELIDDVVGL